MTCSCSAIKDNDNNNNIVKKNKFNTKKIYESFYDVLKYSNYDIIKCYNIISDIKNITSNTGSIIATLSFVCYFICLIAFIFRGINPLKIKLRNEMNKIKNNNKFVTKSNLLKNTGKRLSKKNYILNQTIRTNIKNIKKN